MRILVVDDESDIRTILKYNLTKEGYEVGLAESARQALSMDPGSFDLILLDVMMEGMSGFEAAAYLKSDPATSRVPIVFLTALGEVNDRVEGFESGADDYITKPFSIKELVLRVKAVLKRTAASVVPSSPVSLDEDGKNVIVDGEPVMLSRNSYEILKLLLTHPGRVYSREEILSKAWPDDVIVTVRTVDVTITRLRKRLGRYGSRIVSRHGFGYLWEEES